MCACACVKSNSSSQFFEIYPCCCMYQYFALLLMSLCYIDIPLFVDLFTCRQVYVCSDLELMRIMHLEHSCKLCMRTYVLFLFAQITKNVISVLNFQLNFYCLFYFLPKNSILQYFFASVFSFPINTYSNNISWLADSWCCSKHP